MYTNNWKLKLENLKFLNLDLISLKNIFFIFQYDLFLKHYLEMSEGLTNLD